MTILIDLNKTEKIIGTIFIFILFGNIVGNSNLNINPSKNDVIYPKSATNHPPIIISQNSDFTTANGIISGDGTSGNPYLIEKLNFNTDQSDCIYLTQTNAYVIIQNCTLSCKCCGGIEIQDSANVYILNNHISNSIDGIFLSRVSSNCVIANNVLLSDNYGIYTDGQHNNISDNLIQNSEYGIYGDVLGNYNLIWDNSIYNSSYYSAYDISTTDQWYFNGTGNYYSDYSTQNPNATHNGNIWKTPFQISGAGNDVDLFPLVNPSIEIIANSNSSQIGIPQWALELIIYPVGGAMISFFFGILLRNLYKKHQKKKQLLSLKDQDAESTEDESIE
jgi:parallel beta-helix repeat protein